MGSDPTLDAGTLDADEQALVDRVGARRDDLVALLLLNGHIDVAPARREDGWEHDPWVRDWRLCR